MTAQVHEKYKKNSVNATEAERLQRLREEASKITKLAESGKITSEQARRDLQDLASRNVTFGYRMFGI